MSDQAQKEAERAQGPPGKNIGVHDDNTESPCFYAAGQACKAHPETLGCGEHTASSVNLSRGPVIGTDDGREMWLDYVTDPHTGIAWVVDDPPVNGQVVSSDVLTVHGAIDLAPGHRDEIIDETRDVIRLQAEIIASDHHANYPPEHYVGVLEALSELARELAEVAGK